MTDSTQTEVAEPDAVAADLAEDAELPESVTASATAPDAAAGQPRLSASALDKAVIEDIEEAMRDVVDPELGINVVDLGLVYGIDVSAENVVTLDMTLTSAACPLTDVIEDQARSALVDGADSLASDLVINWVWLPPWGPDKITEDGREQLRALGFNV